MAGPVLVTGAAGFVGSHLVDALAQLGTPIVAWRRPDSAPPPAANGVRWMDVELLDREQVRRSIDAVKPVAVYHMAGAAHLAQSWQRVRETYEGNVRVTHYLLDAVAAMPDRPRVLLPCTAHVYVPQSYPIREDDAIRPTNPYATSKLAVEMRGEKAWTDDGVPAIIARAFNHIGPRQDPSYVAPSVARQVALIEQGRLDPVLTMGNLAPRRDVTDVRDTVRAYLALMENGRPGVRYNVASGRGLAIGELAHAFTAAAHRDVRIIEDPARFRPNDPLMLVGDNTRLVTETGWQPQIPLEQTVQDLLNYWRDRVKAES